MGVGVCVPFLDSGGRRDLSLSRSAPPLLRWTRPKSVSPPHMPSSPQAHPSVLAHTSQSSPSPSPGLCTPEDDDEEGDKENMGTAAAHVGETLKSSPLRARVEKESALGRSVGTAANNRKHQQSLMTTQGELPS